MDPELNDTTVITPPAPAPAAPTPAPPPPDRGDVVVVAKAPAAEPAPAPTPADPGDPDPTATADAPSKPKQGSDHVPITRFNEVNERKKALEIEVADLRAKVAQSPAPAPAPTPAPPAFDEDAQETAYAEALMEGDTAKATKIRREINAHIREQSIATATETVRGEMNAKEVGTSLQQASEQAVKEFPYLDTEEGAEALELIVASRDRRIAQGVKPAEALRLAVAAIAPKFAPAEAPAPAADTREPLKDTRTATALARGATASVAQPPAVQAGIGNRATAAKVDVAELTDEQFDALSPAEKKKLRGD